MIMFLVLSCTKGSKIWRNRQNQSWSKYSLRSWDFFFGKIPSVLAQEKKLSIWPLSCQSRGHWQNFIFTPPWNRGGVVFSLQFVCVCACLSVCLSVCLCVCLSVSEQSSSWTDAPIWMRFSLNGWSPDWLGLDLSKLVTWSQSPWRNILFFMIL